MNNRKAITIYLIEKLNILLETALHDIQAELTVCHSREEAKQAIKSDHYCLIVIDASGVTTERAQRSLERLRQHTYAPVLVLAPDRAAGKLLCAGADMCMSDTMPPESVVPQALALYRRDNLYSQYDAKMPDTATLYRGELAIDPARICVTLSGKKLDLQRQEYLLLLYFAKNPGIVLSPEQICERAWNTNSSYIRDVSPTIATLRRKLGDNRENPQYIETVYGFGYRFLPTN